MRHHVLTFLLLTLAPLALGQLPPVAPQSTLMVAPPPANLLLLRQKFEQSLAQETITLNELFAPHLTTLETSAGAAGDYALALAASRRRTSLHTETQELKRLLAGGSALTLYPADARVNGGILLRDGTLTDFTSKASAVEWAPARVNLGQYEIELSYTLLASTATGPQAGPELKLSEISTLTLASATLANAVSFSLAPSPVSPTLLRATGMITISRPQPRFRLELVSNASALPVAVHGVRLHPVVPTPAPAGDPPSYGLDALADLKKQHQERLKLAREPVVRDYMDMLNSLGEKGAGARVVAAEVKWVQKSLLAPVASSPNTPVMNAGFSVLQDVRYVDDPANTGDRFLVEHEGQRFPVRLIWVTAPPKETSDSRAMKLTQERFKIDPLQALALGQAASEFTALYLKERPLKLLTRATPTADGSLLALVHVEPIGLFQNVLIDYGLAFVDRASGEKSQDGERDKRDSIEAGLMSALQEREKLAQNAAVKAGGWNRDEL